MKHISSSGSIYNNIGDIVFLKELTGFIENFSSLNHSVFLNSMAKGTSWPIIHEFF
jgi:hypothetical protein